MSKIRIVESDGEREVDLSLLSRSDLLDLKLTLTGRATAIKTKLEEYAAQPSTPESEAWAVRAERARRFLLAHLRAIDCELAHRPKPPKPGSRIRKRPESLARFREQNAPPDDGRVTAAMSLGLRDLAERFVSLEDRFARQLEHGELMAADRAEYGRTLRVALGALVLLAHEPTAREAIACVESAHPTILKGIEPRAEAAE